MTPDAAGKQQHANDNKGERDGPQGQPGGEEDGSDDGHDVGYHDNMPHVAG